MNTAPFSTKQAFGLTAYFQDLIELKFLDKDGKENTVFLVQHLPYLENLQREFKTMLEWALNKVPKCNIEDAFNHLKTYKGDEWDVVLIATRNNNNIIEVSLNPIQNIWQDEQFANAFALNWIE